MRYGKIAFCGILAALAVALLLATASPLATAALAALAGAVGVPVVIELSRRAALMHYAAVAVLALLVVPTWEGKALYIGFFGWYTVLKSLVESRLPRLAEWAVKLAACLVALGGGFLAAMALSIPLPAWHPAVWAGAAVAAVAAFVLYDIGLTQLISAYCRRLRATVSRMFRF